MQRERWGYGGDGGRSYYNIPPAPYRQPWTHRTREKVGGGRRRTIHDGDSREMTATVMYGRVRNGGGKQRNTIAEKVGRVTDMYGRLGRPALKRRPIRTDTEGGGRGRIIGEG